MPTDRGGQSPPAESCTSSSIRKSGYNRPFHKISLSKQSHRSLLFPHPPGGECS